MHITYICLVCSSFFLSLQLKSVPPVPKTQPLIQPLIKSVILLNTAIDRQTHVKHAIVTSKDRVSLTRISSLSYQNFPVTFANQLVQSAKALLQEKMTKNNCEIKYFGHCWCHITVKNMYFKNETIITK